MHQNNNDITKSEYEWTIPRYGTYAGSFTGWCVGGLGNDYVPDSDAVRPVFYLKSNQVLSSGDGSLENPFIILSN